MKNRKLVISVVALVAVALIAWPVYAHCGKCAGSAKEMVAAMDAGKVTLASATTAAETAAKGKAVHAIAGVHNGKLDVYVYVLAGEKIMEVVVDGTGKAGEAKEVKMLPGIEGHDQKEVKKPAPKGG